MLLELREDSGTVLDLKRTTSELREAKSWFWTWLGGYKTTSELREASGMDLDMAWGI